VPTAYALIARGSGSPNDVARRLDKESKAVGEGVLVLTEEVTAPAE